MQGRALRECLQASQPLGPFLTPLPGCSGLTHLAQSLTTSRSPLWGLRFACALSLHPFPTPPSPMPHTTCALALHQRAAGCAPASGTRSTAGRVR